MVGNKGKGTRSKPKALKKGPAEPQPQPSQISPDDSVDVALDGEGGKNDISNETEILLEETKLSGSVVNDGLKENDQNALVDNDKENDQNALEDNDKENDQSALEDNDLEKDVASEIKAERTEDCTGEGTLDGVKEVSDGDHIIANLGVEDNEETINTDNLEEDKIPLKIDNIGVSTGGEMEVTTEDVSANSEALASDEGLKKNMTDNLENNEEPSNNPLSTSSGTEVKVVTGQINRPKRKGIKKKLVKKKLVRRNAVPQPSEENNASGNACEVDAHEHVNMEVKASDVDNASDEACKADINEHVRNEEEPEVNPSVTINKKSNRIRKKKAPQSHSGITTIQDTQKPHSQNDELGTETHIAINEADVKNDETEKSKDNAGPLKKSKMKKIAKKGSQEVVSKDVKKPKEGTSSKKVDSMGMIFMCSSETKKDCFRYNVLGLPAGKKDMVLKIYKGMRLFLFDVDLRMMYGIFKAAGPGGYNIEPRAFNSQFPSQVRFTVFEDSVPLAEERFRKVLKDNYYSKNKFNFQLNQEQVKNLCKLFHEASKKAESTKAASRSQRAGATSSTAQRDNKRKRIDDTRRVAAGSSSTARRDNKRKRVDDNYRVAAGTSSTARRDKRKRVDDSHRVLAARPLPLEREKSRRRAHKETRRSPMVIADRYRERPTYEREAYVPSVAPVTIYQPLPPPRSPPRRQTYSYERVLEADPYRRETVIDSRDLAPSRELRLPIEWSHYDSYLSYREPPQVYSGQAYSSDARTYYDYTPRTSDRQYAAESEFYRSADYHPPPAPPLPLYRRY